MFNKATEAVCLLIMIHLSKILNYTNMSMWDISVKQHMEKKTHKITKCHLFTTLKIQNPTNNK